jgi:hypothetical protein
MLRLHKRNNRERTVLVTAWPLLYLIKSPTPTTITNTSGLGLWYFTGRSFPEYFCDKISFRNDILYRLQANLVYVTCLILLLKLPQLGDSESIWRNNFIELKYSFVFPYCRNKVGHEARFKPLNINENITCLSEIRSPLYLNYWPWSFPCHWATAVTHGGRAIGCRWPQSDLGNILPAELWSHLIRNLTGSLVVMRVIAALPCLL